MLNIKSLKIKQSILKQNLNVKLVPLKQLKNINIFLLPSKIKNSDINAMFGGVLSLFKQKIIQEQNEKYIRLKLQYQHLKNLYLKLKSST